MSTTFTSPFTGTVVVPTDVSYYALALSENTQLYWPAVVNPTQVPAARIMDVTPSATGLFVSLPQANQGSVGTDILINNKGAFSITITDFNGAETVTIAPGVGYYFYLIDNTTEGGNWSNVTFGAGTSAADADALQGAGLTTIAGQLAVTSNIVQITSTPTINDASRAATYVWNSGNGTITLPAAATLSGGWWIGFRNNGTGTLNFGITSPSLINGISTISTNPGDSGYILFEKSTGNFFTVGWAVPSNVTFTSSTYDVDSIVGSTFNLVSYAPIIQTYVALSGTRTTDLLVYLPAVTQIYVLANTTAGSYAISFQVYGSSYSPIAVSAGTVTTILSDGNQIYVLTQAGAGSYFAVNGSASAPSFSFNNDTHTGMYLVGTSVLGLTANSTKLLNLDGSNTSSPQVSTVATFNAGLIPGGTF